MVGDKCKDINRVLLDVDNIFGIAAFDGEATCFDVSAQLKTVRALVI